MAALIRKFYEAKMDNKPEVIVWGSGQQKREFLHVDDLAEAALFLMEEYDSGAIINVGFGKDISIKELATMIKEASGYYSRQTYTNYYILKIKLFGLF